MAGKIELSENMENYLETILDLETENKVARGKDIADRLGVQKGSVSGALKTLKEKGLVNYEPYSFITLTPRGKSIARAISRKHEVLRDFLQHVLQIDPVSAEEAACRMEHAINDGIQRRLKCFVEYIHKCPKAGEQWLESFIEFCETKEIDPEKCSKCMETIPPAAK